jgi:hypothetical protein
MDVFVKVLQKASITVLPALEENYSPRETVPLVNKVIYLHNLPVSVYTVQMYIYSIYLYSHACQWSMYGVRSQLDGLLTELFFA